MTAIENAIERLEIRLLAAFASDDSPAAARARSRAATLLVLDTEARCGGKLCR
jgi:hypothetical protein